MLPSNNRFERSRVTSSLEGSMNWIKCFRLTLVKPRVAQRRR